MSHVLAIDLGSTGVKVAVVDPDGRLLAAEGEPLPTTFTEDGGAEQDPEQWWRAIGTSSRRAIAAAGVRSDDLTTVAVTSQYTSTIAIDAVGRPLANVVMWMDSRGRRHYRGAAAEDLELWIEQHGSAPSGHDGIGHIRFIEAEWPDVYAAAAAFVEPMDALAARMTGTITATQSTVFPMFTADNRIWGATTYSDELLACSGLDPAKLPPLVPLGAPRGSITGEAADHLGVSTHAVVAGATIDSITSAVGTGATDHTRVGLVIGTTSVMVTHVDTKRHDLTHGMTSAPSPLPNSWFIVAENGIGGKALDVFVNNVVYPDDGLGPAAGDDAYERVLAAASSAPAGSNGVLFLPWLLGSMAPTFDRRARGGFVNLGLGSTRRDMARAVLEGVALNAAWLRPHFSALANATHREISLGGGGARSSTWGQIIADVTGLPVRRLAHAHATNALGAALLALAERGRISYADLPSMPRTEQVHEPDASAAGLHRHRLGAFVDFHQRALPFYEALNTPEPAS